MFLDQNARDQRVGRIAVHDRYGPLNNDRPVIELRCYQVDGDAGDGHAMLEGLPRRVDPGEGRQQGRMNIEDSVGVRLKQRRPNQTHIAGKAHQANIARAQFTRNRTVVLIARRRCSMVKAKCLDAGTARAFEAGGIGSVRNNDRHRSVEASVTRGINERLQVGATPRDQNAKAAVHGRLT